MLFRSNKETRLESRAFTQAHTHTGTHTHTHTEKVLFGRLVSAVWFADQERKTRARGAENMAPFCADHDDVTSRAASDANAIGERRRRSTRLVDALDVAVDVVVVVVGDVHRRASNLPLVFPPFSHSLGMRFFLLVSTETARGGTCGPKRFAE